MSFDLEIFSPIHAWNHQVFAEKKLKVFIKRDDLIHPLISGNKWRKLKYILQEAHRQQKSHLVTFGGAFSNHLLATAAAGARFGFKTTGFVRGEEVQNNTLFLCRLHGMNLIFTNREHYKNKPALFESYFVDDTQAYFINEGAASPEAVKGCSELINELPTVYDHIFCACGTGTTAAGIIAGLQQRQLPSLFHAIPVFKNGEFMRQEINNYLDTPTDYELHTAYHFGGYAKTTTGLINFIKSFVASTGILIEPVYTAKALYAVLDLATRDYFKPESNILVIHSGGIFGLLGLEHKF